MLAQAVAEAQAQNAPATIAVVDRVGNTLAVYRMNGARSVVQITSNRGVTGGLEGLNVPSELAAIAKAITGAYLSSEGNAFSTRTASQIVQQHFNPGELGTPAGPLFGVQFSQLPCSDFSTRFVSGHGVGLGPFRSPLGLSADPGGFPLYKNGTVVGGIGVGLLSCAILITNNLRDIPGDTVAGKRTLAVRIGDRATRVLYAAVVATGLLAAVVLAATTSWWVALTALTGVLAIGPVRVVLGGAQGPALIPALKATGLLLLAYGLVAGGLLAIAAPR